MFPFFLIFHLSVILIYLIDNSVSSIWQLVHYVFNPALVGGNLADRITFENVVLLWVLLIWFRILVIIWGFAFFLWITVSNLFWLWFRWFMPVNILLTFIIGYALGWILIKLTKAPKHLEGLIMGVCFVGRIFSSKLMNPKSLTCNLCYVFTVYFPWNLLLNS